MKTALLASALVLAASAALAQGAPPAPAPSAPAPAAAEGQAQGGQGEFEMSCALFRHNADGSWQVTQPMTLQPAGGPIPLKPTAKIRRGTLYAGFDLAAALDGACAR